MVHKETNTLPPYFSSLPATAPSQLKREGKHDTKIKSWFPHFLIVNSKNPFDNDDDDSVSPISSFAWMKIVHWDDG